MAPTTEVRQGRQWKSSCDPCEAFSSRKGSAHGAASQHPCRSRLSEEHHLRAQLSTVLSVRKPKSQLQWAGFKLSLRRVHRVVGSDAAFASLLVLLCTKSSGKSYLGSDVLNSRREDGERLGSDCSSQSVQRSSESLSLRHQRPCYPLVAIFVPWLDMFFDGWASVRDPLLQLAREVFTVHSSPVLIRTLRDQLFIRFLQVQDKSSAFNWQVKWPSY